MAQVSIDVAAMKTLVKELDSAKTDITSAASTISGNLEAVWLSEPSLAKVKSGGSVESFIDESLRDLNRRLALARMLVQTTPGLEVVTFDDSVLSDASAEEIDKVVSELEKLMETDDDNKYDREEIDPRVIEILDEYATDPYFAKALAEKISPEELEDYLGRVNAGLMFYGDGKDAKAEYNRLLDGFGLAFGTASHGTGSLEVKGMNEAWATYFKDHKHAMDGGPNRLSVVIGRGLWSDEFLVGTYRAIREAEEDGARWAVTPPDEAFDTFADDDKFFYTAVDPLKGVFTAMQSNPGAMKELFTGGEQTTITVDGKKVEVNAELRDLMENRDWPDAGGHLDEEQQAITQFGLALQYAMASPPVVGEDAWQPELADDATALGTYFEEMAKKAEEERGPWWKRLAHGILDVAGLVPVIGEAADFVNGIWYYADGDVINGSLSMGAMIPGVGYAAVGGKWTKVALKADEVAELTKLAKSGDGLRVFSKEGKLLRDVDLTDPANFAPGKWLSETEKRIFSGSREHLQAMIAGNRFNYFANPRYKYSEIALGKTPKGGRVRVDAWTPGEAIVSRKLTQLNQVEFKTAKGYLDNFLDNYPAGTKIPDTPKNRDLGIAGKTLDGKMILEVPPQVGGKVDPKIVKYAEENGIFIRDINGTWYTRQP